MAMMRLALATVFAGALVLTAAWTGRAQQQPAGATPPRFTGTSTQMEGKDLTIARRRFEPGARTYWHSHERGQLLMVEQGRMRTQKRGAAMQELGVGGTDYTAPKVVHWHGASPDQTLIQINAGFGGTAQWFEEVTADEYAGKKR
jgi:quercetin dioxygenase-like cupin family protein